MLVELGVAEVMTTPVETISPGASLSNAADRLAEGYGSLVVARNGDVAGIVTQSDLVRALAEDRTDDVVETAMSTPAISVHEADDLAAAAGVLGEADVGQVVVLDDADDVVGVLSATDVVDYVPELARHHDVPGSEEPERASEDDRRGHDRHGHVREPGRVDTAYEEAGWEFAYTGGDGIAVGDVATFSKPVTEADVEEFGHATGDTNRLHLDESFATETRFGRRIAHGVLSLGLVSAALARMPGAIIYLAQDCSYLGPVDLGDTVTARCEVTDALANDRYRIAISATNADGAEVLSGGSTILVDDVPTNLNDGR
jgi:acyl dehydratase/predicted transcriptional regulator